MTEVLNALELAKPMTLAEFEVFLEKAKKLNPEKFAVKEARGEFEKARKLCSDYKEKKVK